MKKIFFASSNTCTVILSTLPDIEKERNACKYLMQSSLLMLNLTVYFGAGTAGLIEADSDDES